MCPPSEWSHMQVCLYKTEAIFTSMSATWYYFLPKIPFNFSLKVAETLYDPEKRLRPQLFGPSD